MPEKATFICEDCTRKMQERGRTYSKEEFYSLTKAMEHIIMHPDHEVNVYVETEADRESQANQDE